MSLHSSTSARLTTISSQYDPTPEARSFAYCVDRRSQRETCGCKRVTLYAAITVLVVLSLPLLAYIFAAPFYPLQRTNAVEAPVTERVVITEETSKPADIPSVSEDNGDGVVIERDEYPVDPVIDESGVGTGLQESATDTEIARTANTSDDSSATIGLAAASAITETAPSASATEDAAAASK